MTGEPDRLLAAEYAIGLLDGETYAATDRRAQTDRAFAALVEQWRRHFSAFDDSAPPAILPDDFWQRVESRIATPASSEPRIRGAGFWSSLFALRATAVSATLAALLLAIGLGFALREARQQPQMIAVLVDGDRAGAVVHVFADGRTTLLPLTTIPVPAGRALQVWTLPSKERGPVSIGLMPAARTLPLQWRDLPRAGPDQLFEITLEPAGGSPTGRPTGPILFKGNTATTL